MASRDDDSLKGLKERTPILSAVAYPPHLAYVPLQLWIVNFLLASSLGFWVGMPRGDGIRVDVTLAAAIIQHIFFMIKYRRDRHIWKVWRARFWAGEPFPAWRGTMNLLRRRMRRRVNRFCG